MELTGKAKRFYLKFIGTKRMVACSSSQDVSYFFEKDNQR
jgi:hypothetical protein